MAMLRLPEGIPAISGCLEKITFTGSMGDFQSQTVAGDGQFQWWPSDLLIVKSPILVVKSPILVVKSPILVVKSPFLVVKSPILVVKSPFLDG